MIILKTPNLFDNLLEISIGDKYFDLHNEFNCTELVYDKEANFLTLSFVRLNRGDETLINSHKLTLLFHNVELLKIQVPFVKDGITLDNFHRGRYLFENKLYDEIRGKMCFYLEFIESQYLEFLAEKVTIEENSI